MKVAAEKYIIQHFAIIEWINIIIWLIVVIVTHTDGPVHNNIDEWRLYINSVINGGLYAVCSSMLNALCKDVVLLLCCQLHVELFMIALNATIEMCWSWFFFSSLLRCHSSTVAVAVVTVSICLSRSNYIIMLVCASYVFDVLLGFSSIEYTLQIVHECLFSLTSWWLFDSLLCWRCCCILKSRFSSITDCSVYHLHIHDGDYSKSTFFLSFIFAKVIHQLIHF